MINNDQLKDDSWTDTSLSSIPNSSAPVQTIADNTTNILMPKLTPVDKSMPLAES